MKKNRGLPCDDILQYEAEWNARLLYNEVHRNAPIEEFPPYEEIVEAYNCRCRTNPQYPLHARQPNLPTLTPEETHHQERTEVATNHLQVQANQEEVEGSLLSHHNLPPHLCDGRYRAIQHLQRHPLLLYLGNSSPGTSLPYNEFKPKILKEVDDFHGDSNDISQFFLKCELHFDLYNRHYRYPPT